MNIQVAKHRKTLRPEYSFSDLDIHFFKFLSLKRLKTSEKYGAAPYIPSK